MHQRPLSERIRPTEHLPPRVQHFQLLNRENSRLQRVIVGRVRKPRTEPAHFFLLKSPLTIRGDEKCRAVGGKPLEPEAIGLGEGL